MKDPRIEKLSVKLVRQAYRVGGVPYLTIKNNELLRVLLTECSEDQLKEMASFEIARMREMKAYIGLRVSENASEMGSVPPEKMKMYMEHYVKPLHHDIRVRFTKWCILRYPNHSMAQLANMSTEDFEDFYFKVCNLDYSKMSNAMDNLVKLMENTDKVRIYGRDTDLAFSIKGLPAIKCDGKHNIPDGEVYTAPVKESVNGVITYNIPAEYQGVKFENIRLEFKDGKIIKATSSKTDRINSILDTDEGARYIGEFALGVNPYVENPMNDTLFDEKIKGSLHFTPGSCYDECDNGNKSSIHWDLVLIQWYFYT